MKGTYNKSAISAIIDPLKAISSVFGGKEVHVVYENGENDMFVSAQNKKRSVRVMYELDVKEVIKDYSVAIPEAGIWDVKQFIDQFGKYSSDLYTEDVELDVIDNRLVIKCDDETTNFYLGQLDLFKETRTSVRKLKTDSLTEACKFTLSGTQLKKLVTNIGVYYDLDQITFVGENGKNYMTVKLSSASSTLFNDFTLQIRDVEVKEDFNLKFMKEDFKGLLCCNDKFEFTVYTGPKSIVNVNYSRDHYDMRFYFSPLGD